MAAFLFLFLQIIHNICIHMSINTASHSHAQNFTQKLISC